MWIFLNNAFLSVVAPPGLPPDSVLVRARRKGDIERAFAPLASVGHLVKQTPHRDYAFRAEVPRSMFADVMAHHARSISYGNFKSSIRDARLHDAASRVWGVMATLQETAPYSGEPRTRTRSAQRSLLDSDVEVLPGNLDAVERKLAARGGSKPKAAAARKPRAPGLDDGESPFHPIPGVSSAGEY